MLPRTRLNSCHVSFTLLWALNLVTHVNSELRHRSGILEKSMPILCLCRRWQKFLPFLGIAVDSAMTFIWQLLITGSVHVHVLIIIRSISYFFKYFSCFFHYIHDSISVFYYQISTSRMRFNFFNFETMFFCISVVKQNIHNYYWWRATIPRRKGNDLICGILKVWI